MFKIKIDGAGTLETDESMKLKTFNRYPFMIGGEIDTFSTEFINFKLTKIVYEVLTFMKLKTFPFDF